MPRSAEPNPVALYLSSLRAIHATGAHVPETSFYPPLEALFNAVGHTLKPRVLFVLHPGNRDRNLPDGGLFPVARGNRTEPLPNQIPERGVVEVKPADHSITTLQHDPQVRRYLTAFGLCLITNLHQFRLLDLHQGEPRVLEPYDLTTTADDLWHQPLKDLVDKHAETLPDFIERCLTRKVPLSRPRDVARLLASYAREARARVAEHPIPAFAGVRAALQESLGITFEGDKGEHFFRSTLIQTLFYGIFSAWVLWRRTPDFASHNGIFNWRLSADYLRLPVLRSLFHAVSERGALNTVHVIEVLDRATDALNRVEPDFFTTFRENEAVQYFYEPFLEAFDPDLRKQLGVWYTPREIVRYMVERVDHLLRTELHEPLGLASPNVQVLDPCCGTGAYLVEVLHRIHRTLLEQAGDDPHYVPSDLRRAATSRIFGFEIMPAPFVIAHLQITQLLEDAHASLAESQRAQVFLTNALTGWLPATHPVSTIFPEFDRERDAAEAVKQADTILVILGNPPYNGYAGIAIGEERGLTNRYKASDPETLRPEGKGLNDLYVRFFRIAERRIVGGDGTKGNQPRRGVISLISNYSWLDGFSHPSMRSHLLKSFDRIQIDNLNGDKYRTGKTTPDGKPDPSAFSTPQNREGIQVGTAITTLLRSRTEPASCLQIRNFWGLNKLKQLGLETRGEAELRYESLEPEPLLGRPFANLQYEAAYLTWPLLTRLFLGNYNGIQTSRDALLVGMDPDHLLRQVKRHISATRELTDVHMWHVRRYYYRPFDVRWIYWHSKPKFLVRSREEYVGGHFGSSSLVLPKQNRITVSGCLVARGLVDLNFVDGGAAVFAEEVVQTTPLQGPLQKSNMSALAEMCLEKLSLDQSALPLHILAVSHAPSFTDNNYGALQRDWPRIPLPATADLLTHSADLGRRLADLLDPESSINLVAEWSFLARLILPAEHPEGTPDRDRRNAARLALTAGWGRPGQGSTVMPSRGKFIERDWTPTERDRLATLATMQHDENGPALTLDDALALLGTRCVDVNLNDAALWSAVPTKVWEYTLGGYQVLKKWLSYREEPLLGRPLHEDEARYFAQVVRRITAILLLGPALDHSYAAILPTATGLPRS